MTQRFYFDTSVFGGVFDEEFAEVTATLFEKVKLGLIVCVYSDLSESELSKASQKVIAFFNTIPEKYKLRFEVTPEALSLAKSYMTEKVVGQSSFDDCVHIALATIHKVDILVSWNFKHIVNVYRIRGYNSVNLRMGYTPLEIRSPKDIVSNETED